MASRSQQAASRGDSILQGPIRSYLQLRSPLLVIWGVCPHTHTPAQHKNVASVTAFYHLWLVLQLQLSQDLITVFHALGTSRLNYSNALYLPCICSGSFNSGRLQQPDNSQEQITSYPTAERAGLAANLLPGQVWRTCANSQSPR